jgi:MoCo/4Fe-4S cofactor protein with predicted Tat translocation signal
MIELDVISKADAAADGQPRQWRSLAHRAQTSAYEALASREFHPEALADEAEAAADPSRRTFMKTIGASMALAGVGLSGCRRPVEKVMPFVRQPEEIIPGIPNFYATAMPMAGVVHPLLVESHEGRPTKIEGNPEHPAALGKSNVFAQASILNLYDPDRARRIRYQGAEASWADFVAFARTVGGARVAVLSEPTSSLTLQRLRQQLATQLPGSRWISYRAAGDDPQAVAFGNGGVRPLYRFSQARTVVSFDADFVQDPAAGVWNAREFAASRSIHTPQDEMSRLYVIESTMTPTGGMADHRLRMRASEIPAFAQAVAGGLGQGGASRVADPRAAAFIQAIAEDAQVGPALFVAGPTQPAEVHRLCAQLNAAHAGGAVEYVSMGGQPGPPQAEAFAALVRDMNAGLIDALVTIGVNPVYDAPAGLNFAEAMGRVATTVHLGLHRDETASQATWLIPRAHYLEAWGDGLAVDGTVTVIQPLIAPLYRDCRSEIELLSVLLTGRDVPGYDLVRETFREQGLLAAGGFEDAWRTLLHDGFLPDTAAPTDGAAPAAAPAMPAGDQAVDAQGAGDQTTGTPPPADPLGSPLPPQATTQGAPAGTATPDAGVELVLRTDPRLYDGTFSNNPWMLELPEPISKLTWDNVAVISPAFAAELGVHFQEGTFEGGPNRAGRVHASVLSITTPDGLQVALPAWVQPGHPDRSITAYIGWGRQLDTDRVLPTERSLFDRIFSVDTDHYRYGPIGNGIGQAVAAMRPATGPAVIPSVQVEVTGRRYLLASTQDHGSMMGRPILRMGTVDEFRARPTFAQEAVGRINNVPWEEYPPIWGEESSPTADPRIGEAMYSDHQWGMTIDLTACSGCNACIVACQAENNIPIVGKDEVVRGREMQWLRLDRYYVGDDVNEPGMAVMPMMCHHCEYAPCEPVCPVAATSHSPDGINEMTYNRCIGTRYCSNNCPYKVRRYNWFNWVGTMPIERRMQLNPNVTPRFRGIMEKCTWCVQRIRKANRYAHIERRKIADGEVETACQQACPADAIVFGDLTDPDSRVSQLKRTARRYELLEEYNTKPRLSYLARISNPNPRLRAALGVPEDEHEPVIPGPTYQTVPVEPAS